MAFVPIDLSGSGDTLSQGFIKVNEGFYCSVGLAPVGWNAAHTYGSGKLTQTIWSNGVYRVKAVYSYNVDTLTSIAYSYSTNSGGNYTILGTNTLGYTGSDLTSETWS